jgi:Phasin protein
MKTQPTESFNELCTTALEIMKRLDKAGTKVRQDLTNEQLNMVKMSVDYGNRQLEILLSRETPANLLAVQSGIATEFSMKYMDQCRRVFALLTDTGSELMACFNQLKPYWSLTPVTETTAAAETGASETEEEAVTRLAGKPKKTAA